ncbi:DUF5659 domain-containing protein [Paenibacillus sp. ATY16]|nr:DUF5659 domain-containing protein [Paenibacillus sp. ATY16]
MKDKDYPIFNLDVANYLMAKGFKLVRIKPNKFKLGTLIFYFEQNKNIDLALDKFNKTFSKEFSMNGKEVSNH